MMPEEERKPLGEGVAKENGEPTTVRFLDVPGSEETREEKMTAVFTCTVRKKGDKYHTILLLLQYSSSYF